MADLDEMLPNLDDLEVNEGSYAAKDTEKLQEQIVNSILQARSKMSLGQII